MDPIFDVRTIFVCPSFTVMWQAPFTITPDSTTYCVTVSLHSSGQILLKRCLHTTTITAELGCAFNGYFYNVSIVPVNPAGNGSLSSFLCPGTLFALQSIIVPLKRLYIAIE